VAELVTTDAGKSLHERALAGDEDAFEALIGPLVEPGLRLAYSMLGDRAEAEDATQEAITKAWRKLRQLRSGMPVRPWFLAIVMNQCRNVRRTRWFKTIRVSRHFEPGAVAEPDVATLDLQRALARPHR
jgi:RNA polymerase sigma-70 factor (ECF subfamily)